MPIHHGDTLADADDFQRAAAAAQNEAGLRNWYEMLPSEQTASIYSHLRQIDAARAKALHLIADRRAAAQGAPRNQRRRQNVGRMTFAASASAT
jgi:hypothetical protein